MTARANYISDMKAQLRELLTRYDPALLWFDGDWCADRHPQTLVDWWNTDDGRDLYNFLIGIKPNLVVNERVKRNTGLGDYACPERTVPARPLSRPWETCQTMNGAWGYDSRKEGQYRSAQSLLRELVKAVSRDGNYLLNIGPRGDGTVSSGAVNALTGMGTWMSIYSDSIYGTTGSPFASELSWGCYTRKSGKLFAHVLTWPANRPLTIPPLSNTIRRVYLLNNPATSLNYTNGAAASRLPARGTQQGRLRRRDRGLRRTHSRPSVRRRWHHVPGRAGRVGWRRERRGQPRGVHRDRVRELPGQRRVGAVQQCRRWRRGQQDVDRPVRQRQRHQPHRPARRQRRRSEHHDSGHRLRGPPGRR